jgi:hypothetical protein
MRLCTEHLGLLLCIERHEDHWDLQITDRISNSKLYQARCSNADRGREMLGDYLRSQLAKRHGNTVSITDADLIWLRVKGVRGPNR